MNRRRHSSANSVSRATSPRPRVVSSFSPRSRIVSIIPGIDTGAPERTLTSSGSAESPNRRPTVSSTSAIAARISSSRPSGQPSARNRRHVWVVMANPGGTGSTSSRAMTPRLAALPPTSALASSSDSPCGSSSA
jgi:hypothetical protein